MNFFVCFALSLTVSEIFDIFVKSGHVTLKNLKFSKFIYHHTYTLSGPNFALFCSISYGFRDNKLLAGKFSDRKWIFWACSEDYFQTIYIEFICRDEFFCPFCSISYGFRDIWHFWKIGSCDPWVMRPWKIFKIHILP